MTHFQIYSPLHSPYEEPTPEWEWDTSPQGNIVVRNIPMFLDWGGTGMYSETIEPGDLDSSAHSGFYLHKPFPSQPQFPHLLKETHSLP